MLKIDRDKKEFLENFAKRPPIQTMFNDPKLKEENLLKAKERENNKRMEKLKINYFKVNKQNFLDALKQREINKIIEK